MLSSPHDPRNVLCVDDDAGMRQFYETLLSTYGYGVVSAANGHEALEALQSSRAHVDAVICDYEMPGMNGYQVAAEMKRIDPELPVLLMSGYPEAVREAPDFIDAAMPKGTPINSIVEKLDLLMASHRHAESVLHRSLMVS